MYKNLAVVFCFFLLISCDKFDLDFASENNFNLNSGSHEIDVKTKQDYAVMNTITINGTWGLVSEGNVVTGDSVRFDHDEYSVIYRKGMPSEVIGKWFNIKQVDAYTFHISIFENEDNIERNLVINLGWRSAINTINIRQEEK
jgi:hypothetical protein